MSDNKTEKAREYWREALKLSPYLSLASFLCTALLLLWKPQFIFIYWGMHAAAIHLAFDYLFWRSVNLWFFGVFYFSNKICWDAAKVSFGANISGAEETFSYGFLVFGSYLCVFAGVRFLLRHSIAKRVGIDHS